MNVLMISTEAVPFAKSGGLGDVIGSLPKALREEEVDVRVMLPLYRQIKEKYADEMEWLMSFQVGLGWRTQYCGIFSMEKDGIPYYFLDNEQYFNRDRLYGYFDEGERFAFFSKASLDAVSLIDFKPDILHCSEWQSALVPVYKETLYRGKPVYDRIKTLFTIHNIEYQGRFNGAILGEVLGIPEQWRYILDYESDVDYMKGAIVTCDRLSTVSPTYAEEITYDYFGKCLSSVIRENQDKLTGILNGIDQERYNPQTDPHISVCYTSRSLGRKLKNKTALQKTMGLEQRDDIPLVGVVSRLVSHKGIDLILRVIDELLDTPVQLMVLGSGDSRYESAFREKIQQRGGNCAAFLGFSDELANQVYAGVDFLLMPSISEPCGLAQMIALRYGTIPIVRETGGLKDTILPYRLDTERGNGFTFATVNAHDMLGAVHRAVDVFHQKKQWDKIRKNAMKSDCSWNTSCQLYKKLYQDMLEDRDSMDQ